MFCLNFGTGRIRQAKILEAPRHTQLFNLLNGAEMLNYQEIQRYMNLRFQMMLEVEQNDISSPPNYI